MSGLKLVAKTANFQLKSLGFVPPVPRGLIAFYLFGSSSLGTNLAIGGMAGVSVGAPAKPTTYSTRFTYNNYVESQIVEPTDLTIFAVGKRYASAGLRQQWCGNFTGRDAANTINIPGSGVVCEADGSLSIIGASYSGTAGAASSSNGVSITGAGLPANVVDGVWRAAIGRVDSTGTGARSITDLTTGVSATVGLVGSNVRDLRNTSPLRVGALGPTNNGSAAPPTELMLLAVANVVWTPAEEATMYAYAKGYAMRRGITI